MISRLMYWVNGAVNCLCANPWIKSKATLGKRLLYQRCERKLWTYFPSNQVLGGPFEGVRFPHKGGNCSVFFPKLIGCYEAELHPFWTRARDVDYKEIWDIGAADGYYAAGLAILFPSASVTAWEASVEAAKNCSATCEANAVADRVTIRGHCEKEDLLAMPVVERSLIVCDIEGAEMDIFDESNVSLLAGADIVIELHEKFRPGVSKYLIELFGRTHDVTVIDSIPDEVKVAEYEYAPLPEMSAILRRYATSERRYSKMQWLIAEVK